ncbi:hypothetical protein SCHPADRAFT_622388 [Schizopora paradoxa]|uniref:Uncharacterized protein n=1 Tax=Schizopora paradoxa TaxID=27342 RepID=A0A0H2R9N8_9AGAM|nr:hypothetical protein SCHPADRAFT_622388 [Schizopora paradoxa]
MNPSFLCSLFRSLLLLLLLLLLPQLPSYPSTDMQVKRYRVDKDYMLFDFQVVHGTSK